MDTEKQERPAEKESRPKISLGKVTVKQANTAKINIETLIQCGDTGAVMPPAVQDWLKGISDGLRKRLEVLSIIEPKDKGKSYTVEEWTQRYIKSRPDVKAITTGKWQNAANKLSAFFRGQSIDEITVRQAKDYRVYLKSVAGLSENTLRRLIGLSRQFFNAAIDAGIINKNPFRGQPVSVRANPVRFFYVTQEMALKVLETCPDTQWRLLFGLGPLGRTTLSKRSIKAEMARCGL